MTWSVTEFSRDQETKRSDLLLLINQIGTSWNVMENYVWSSSERGASELRSAHSHGGETGWVHGTHVVGGENFDIWNHIHDISQCICFSFLQKLEHNKMPQEGVKIAVPFPVPCPVSTWPLYPLSLDIYPVFCPVSSTEPVLLPAREA